jgi:hypothetical protein
MADEPLNCRRAAKLLSQAQERALRDDEQKALQHHLVLCLKCRNFESQLAFLRKASRLFSEKA